MSQELGKVDDILKEVISGAGTWAYKRCSARGKMYKFTSKLLGSPRWYMLKRSKKMEAKN